MPASEIRLAGICSDCMSRLGVDKRLTLEMQCVKLNQLPEFEPKMMAGVHFANKQGQHGAGTTKITYKVAKTVKETVDDVNSHMSNTGKSNPGSKPH